MTKSHFNSIVKALRNADYGGLTSDESELKKCDAPFWPIKQLAEELPSKLQYMYQFGQVMDIDYQTDVGVCADATIPNRYARSSSNICID